MNDEMIILKELYTKSHHTNQNADLNTTDTANDSDSMSIDKRNEALSILYEHGYISGINAPVTLTQKGIRLAKEL